MYREKHGRKMLMIMLILAIATAVFAQARQISLSTTPSETTIRNNSDLGFEAAFRVSGLTLREVNTREGIFDELSIEGYGYTAKIGEPKLPMRRELIAVPVGAAVSYTITGKTERELRSEDSGLLHRLIPAQESVSKSQDPASFPFVINETAYTRATPSSADLIRVNEVGYMRGLRLFELEFYPVSYDAVQGTIKVVESLDVRVDFVNPDLLSTADMISKTASYEFDRMFSKTVFNWRDAGRPSLVTYPTKMLILCPVNYVTTLQPFVDWKKQQGYNVVVTTVGTGGTVANTTTAIKTYTQNLWNAATAQDPAPTYLILVGDTSTSGDNIIANTGESSSAHVTDLTYVRLNGTDYLPEMYYGRFSVSSATELTNVINKSITWEKTQMADLSYLGKVVMIAGADASYAPTYGNGQINYGTTHYFNSTNGLTSNTYLYPESATSDATIIANANEGRGYMNYTAHGSETSWADPTFSVSDVNAMTNTGKFGVMVGNCCITNKFNYSSGPCFGEAVIRAANKGGVAYIGATNNSYWDEDYWWGIGYKTPIQAAAHAYSATTLGAYDAMFHTHSEAFTDWGTTMGEINYMGNTAVQQSSSTRKPYYWEIYSIMGDPSLMPYLKVPTVNTATFPSTILIGATSINVTAAAYSRVALTMGGVLYGTAIVPASGNLTLTITPFATTGTATLVITAQNKVTRIESVTIAPNSGPYINVAATNYNDANNSIPEYNETGRFSPNFANVGSVAATNITATLTCATAGITITDGSETIASLAAGANTTITNAFSFNVANNIANGLSAQFTITMVSGSNTWTHNFIQVFSAPSLAFGNITVQDPSGNNNGRLDPGETATIIMPLANNGGAASPAGNATLTCGTSGVTVVTGSASFAAIAASGSTNLSFSVSIGSGVTIGTLASLVFNATAGSYTANKTESASIGLILEDFETGNFNAYPWTMGGTLPWTVTNTGAYAGTYAAKSGAITHSQSSTMETTRVLTASGTLSFWYKVSSEGSYDFLKFYIDGTQQASWSGEVGWTQATYTLAAGTRVLKWEYMKDGSVDSGSNCAWVDNIIFPASTAPSVYNPPQNFAAVPGNGYVNLTWQAPTSGTPTGYKIFRNSSLLTTVTGLSYTDNAVVNETSYSYYLKAVYSGGESDPTNTLNVTPTAVVVTEVVIGSGTTATGTSTASPINVYYQSLHGQSVYTAAELNAAGVVGPINITQIGFNIASLPSLTMPNFVVRMGHTTSTNVASWISTGLTQVWSSTSYLPTATGWNMYTLSTPFLWDGTSNIVIDTAFGLIGSYTSTGTVLYSTVTSGYRFARSDTADQTSVFTAGSTSTNRPNVKFVLQPNASGPTIAVNPSTLAFGDVAVGGNSVLQFTILNGGDQNLSGGITTPAGYTVALAARSSEVEASPGVSTRNTLPFIVTAGSSKTYNLTLAPTAATTYNGNVVISSNATNNPSVNIAVTGAGYIPPTIDISSDALYSYLQIGEEGTDSFTITNTGSQPLNYSISMAELRDRDGNLIQASSSQDKSITGSTLAMAPGTYLPGTTVDLTFTATNASTDSEWMEDVIITFPTGVTVNNATSFTGGDGGDMTPDVTSGNGVTITWHGETTSGWGVIYGNGDSATATVNVTIGSTVGGDIALPWTMNGDVYGAEPHTLSGSITVTEDVPPIEWLSVLPMSGTIPAGGNASITAYFSAVGMLPGTYDALLTVHSNDPLNPSLEVSATMDVGGTVNHAPTLALPNAMNFDKNGSLGVDFGAYAADEDGDPLTLQVSGNSNVNAAINGLQVTFTAAQNWTGNEAISFTVSDGSLSAADMMTIYVDPVISPDWTAVTYPNNPATIYGIVTINGTPCNLNDVVGVFVGSECRGTAEVVTNAGNAYVTLLANLASDGETIGFKVWDYETQATYPVAATYSVNFGQVLGATTPVPINGVNFLGPNSTIDPLSLAFGEVEAGHTSMLQFTINNSGDQALAGTITTPAGYSVALAAGRSNALTEAQSGGKAGRNALPYTVAVGATSTFNVTFAPTAVQAYNGSITVTGNDPDTPQTLVALTGSGFTYPTLNINTVHIQAQLAYGASGEQTFTIGNTGSRALSYAIAESPAVDWLSVSPANGSVSATPQTITASIVTGNMAPGNYQSTLLVTTNAPATPEVEVLVELTVINDAPVLAIPETCTFPMGETMPMDFTPYASDANAQPLILGYSGNTNILVQVVGMNVTFSNVDGWYGSETITFSLFDGMDYAYDTMTVTAELVTPDPPVVDPITVVDPDTGVGITWQPVQYATEYQIWRSLTSPVSGFELIGTTSDPSFIDAMTHDKAFYMIKAINNPVTKGGSK